MNSKPAQLTLKDVQELQASDSNIEEEAEIQQERTRPKQKFGNMFSFTSRFLTQGAGTDRRNKRS